METIKKILMNAGCADYADVFEAKGYDSAEHLLMMGPADFDLLASSTGILPGHLHRLRTYISGIKAWAHVDEVTPTEESVPNKGTSAEEVNAATSASFDADLISKGPKAKQQKSLNMIGLEGEYDTWPEAKVASLRYNTAAGCSAMQDRKQCGDRRKVFRCRSVISKRKLKEMEGEGPSNCPHKLVWSKKKMKGSKWILNQEESHLQHEPFCDSGQKVKRCELKHDPEFIKHCKNDKKCTGKSAAKQALGGQFGRLAGAVDDQTARRARNDINHATDCDYEDDWSKLPQWKREFEEKNPNSRCVIETKLKDGLKMFVLICELCGPFVLLLLYFIGVAL